MGDSKENNDLVNPVLKTAAVKENEGTKIKTHNSGLLWNCQVVQLTPSCNIGEASSSKNAFCTEKVPVFCVHGGLRKANIFSILANELYEIDPENNPVFAFEDSCSLLDTDYLFVEPTNLPLLAHA